MNLLTDNDLKQLLIDSNISNKVIKLYFQSFVQDGIAVNISTRNAMFKAEDKVLVVLRNYFNKK
jgi:hypothetical protein